MTELRIDFEPLQDLFSESAVPEKLMKQAIVKNFKMRVVPGALDSELEVDLEPSSGDDILIKKIDPENALGFSVYRNEEDYFHQLSAQLYEPSIEELTGGFDV